MRRPAFILSAVLAAAAAAGLPRPAPAATFGFSLGTASGTFEAPEGGGPISAFLVTIGDTTFDLPSAGADAPFYNPILNTLNGETDVEFRGVAALTGRVFNAGPSTTCPPGDLCVLELFDTAGGTAPPEWAFQNFTELVNVAAGFYAIDPDPIGAAIPLPPALPLLLGGLAGLGLAARRRRGRPETARRPATPARSPRGAVSVYPLRGKRIGDDGMGTQRDDEGAGNRAAGETAAGRRPPPPTSRWSCRI